MISLLGGPGWAEPAWSSQPSLDQARAKPPRGQPNPGLSTQPQPASPKNRRKHAQTATGPAWPGWSALKSCIENGVIMEAGSFANAFIHFGREISSTESETMGECQGGSRRNRQTPFHGSCKRRRESLKPSYPLSKTTHEGRGYACENITQKYV